MPTETPFWELRSPHARDTLFASPQLLWQAAHQYFEWCDENPLIEVDFVGKDLQRVETPKLRAYTLQGFCMYTNCDTNYLSAFEQSLNPDNALHAELAAVIARVRDTIYRQKYEAAVAGLLNATIVSRDLGLADTAAAKQSNTTVMKIEVINNDTKTELENLKE